MMTENVMILTMMQALTTTFLITVIPHETVFSGPYYQLQNTRPPASSFQMIWPSPRVLLMMNPSSVYWNLTPADLTIMMSPLHLLQSESLVPKYIYATTHHLILRSLSITAIISTAYTIASIVRYYISGVSRRNLPVDVKKLRKFFLFKTDNIVMKTLEATTQLGGFDQRLPMRQYNKRFL